MIKIKKKKKKDNIVYFKISGHADSAAYGEDIICAAVTSAVQMTVNGLLEILNLTKIEYREEHGLAICNMRDSGLSGEDFIKADILTKSMETYLKSVADEYPEYVKIMIQEV